MEKTDAQKAVEQLDFTDVAAQVSNLVRAALDGQPTETKKYTVDVEVPVALITVLENLAQVFPNVKVQEIVQQLATVNFEQVIQSKLQSLPKKEPEPTVPLENPLDALKGILDTDRITEGFSKLNDLAKQLDHLEGVIGNEAASIDPTDSK